MLHFHGLSDARHAAAVAGPPRTTPLEQKRGRRTGNLDREGKVWSRARVISELRRLDREEQHTALTDLIEAGQIALVRAASEYVGGLSRARTLAGIKLSSGRTKAHKTPHTEESIIREIRGRQRLGQPLGPTQVPQHLYSAARYRFGSWPAAISAAGVTPKEFRPKLVKYTRKKIIDVLRDAASSGVDLTRDSLARLISIDAVRREFGTLADALVAAGLREQLAERRHGAKLWDRERLIKTLQDRAARGEHTFTPGLFRAVQLHFGGAREARRVAGVPSPVDVRMAQRREAKKAQKVAERTRRRRRFE